MERVLRCGLDIGSTTAKLVFYEPTGSDSPTLVFKAYRRHDARIQATLEEILKDARAELGDRKVLLAITGSAGLGISERLDIPFVQEVVAAADLTQRFYPSVRTLVDIGGEDSKLILFDGEGKADMRMNGACAGGTGSFIDQTASLLNEPIEQFNALAETHQRIYPIASRCGVFAKTDIQNLLARGVSRADVAASVFHAVALQTVNALARGFETSPQVLMSGGPLTFLPLLRKVLLEKLGATSEDLMEFEHPQLISALGAAVAAEERGLEISLEGLLERLEKNPPTQQLSHNREPALFDSEEDYDAWTARRFTPAPRVALNELDGVRCFLGVDSGSTTTKLVVLDEQGRVALQDYVYNRGDAIGAVRRSLESFADQLDEAGVQPEIVGSAVTGYGEDLIRSVFGLGLGVVETIAHLRAARQIDPEVSFVLDIGGQDMKAMYVEDGHIRNIEINEACSSGCGSFIQTFAEVLNIPLVSFATEACTAKAPCSLGSRCTVFMNSRVKQFQREGAEVEDIAAGLAYSVVRNCLTKVLKISDYEILGDHVVVQGGTFLNPAIHRAFEQATGRRARCSEISGLAGAYGSALVALDTTREEGLLSAPLSLRGAGDLGECSYKSLQCKACPNQCLVTRMRFNSGATFYSGNRCERVFSNSGGVAHEPGVNLAEFENRLLFQRALSPVGRTRARARIGLPRALNLFENFPFWSTLFVHLGFEVVLSDESSPSLYEKGTGTIISDSICFPAKMVHGHIIDLIEKKVDRVFYPRVIFERDDYDEALDSYSCPIVMGYPDVILSAIEPATHGVPLDSPVISFRDRETLRKGAWRALKAWKLKRSHFDDAFDRAYRMQDDLRQARYKRTQQVVERAALEGRRVVLLVARPYHLDRYINQGVPDILSQMGVDVITSNSIPPQGELEEVQVLTQWAYPNRLYNAAYYANNFDHVEVVQLNSFGCGPDALATDELVGILRTGGKSLTVVRIDESASPGSIKLRLRTLVETLRIRGKGRGKKIPRRTTPTFMQEDRGRKILVPAFSPGMSMVIESSFKDIGYDVEVLPPADAESLTYGLKYVNNEICYPAILVIGDLIKALESGKYDLSNLAVGVSQTAGQCRASNYLNLLNKALIASGHFDIPVVSFELSGTSLHPQPGFTFNRNKLATSAFFSIVVNDALTMMGRALSVREEIPGQGMEIAKRHLDRWLRIPKRGIKEALTLVDEAIDEFLTVEHHDKGVPRIGVVGEIYVKYGAFSNHNIVEWLTKQGVEVIVPQLTSFFIQELTNTQHDLKHGLRKPDLTWMMSFVVEARIVGFLKKMNRLLERFPFVISFPTPRQLAAQASQVLELINRYGEGWLIAGEMMQLAMHGVENILCLQPFGCIANQVVAKGIEKRLRKKQPNLSVLFVDLDHNTSEANMLNRVHFLVRNAQQTAARFDAENKGGEHAPREVV